MAAMAALCIKGESEWVTGSPASARIRVESPTLLLAGLGSRVVLAHDASDGRREQRLQLHERVPIIVEVAAVGILHLGVVAIRAPEGAEQVALAAPADHLRALHVRRAHAEHEICAL